MSAKDFMVCTPREFQIRRKAHLKRINAEAKLTRELNREKWRQARFIAYCAAKPYFPEHLKDMSPFDWYPLPGDPTQKERQRMDKKQLNKSMETAIAIQEQYRKMKLVK